MKKNKLTNFLKIGILFFGISLLLWNCDTENEPIENNQSNLLEKLQSNFNSENFKEALPYDFEIQWTNSLKQYSEELETLYYEFPITYTSKFNPDEILKSKSLKSKYNISYKILITENEKQEYIYYVVKFYKENSKNTSHLEKSFAGSSDFSGFIHLLNKSGDIVFAKKFEGGIEDSKKFYNKEFKEKRNKDENLYARVDETCTTVTTHSWTDNYVRWGNDTPILVSSTYNGSTTTESCESYWLPDLNIFGGGGTGSYIKNSNGGIYNDCNTPSCKYEIRDILLGVQPALGADCRSFEYAQPPGALQKGAAVLNFNHTFVALTPTGDQREVESNVAIAYFTAPPTMTNGRAANLTAIAVTAAIKATDIYYALNPYATMYDVGDFFKSSLQNSLKLFGGSISTDPPFYIRSPAPYITHILGIGNPIDC